MVIAVDTNQTSGRHEKSNQKNHSRLLEMGHQLTSVPLPYGDYVEVTPQVEEVLNRRGNKIGKMDLMFDIKVAVDRKNSIDECAGNICGADHERFREEAIRAQKAGAKFYVLVENDQGITDLDGVKHWDNPRMHRYNKIKYMHSIGKWQSIPLPKKAPTASMTLFKAMWTMQKKYDVKWVFVRPEDAAQKIAELLGGETE